MSEAQVKSTPANTDFMKEHRESIFGRASHAALLFCIAFTFLVPSLLLWRVAL